MFTPLILLPSLLANAATTRLLQSPLICKIISEGTCGISGGLHWLIKLSETSTTTCPCVYLSLFAITQYFPFANSVASVVVHTPFSNLVIITAASTGSPLLVTSDKITIFSSLQSAVAETSSNGISQKKLTSVCAGL